MSKIWPIYDHATHERQLLMLHAKPILAEQVIAAQHARDGRRIVIARVRGVTERDLYPALWRALLPLFPVTDWSDTPLHAMPGSYPYSLPEDLRLAHKVLYQSALWCDRDGDEAATARMEGARGWLTGTRAGNKHARRAYHIGACAQEIPPHVQAQLVAHALHWRQVLTGQRVTLLINLQHHHRNANGNWRNEWMRALVDADTHPAPILVVAAPKPTWRDDVWSRLLGHRVRLEV